MPARLKSLFLKAKKDIAKKVIENGIYLAQLTDELFKLKIPRNFIPRAFQSP